MSIYGKNMFCLSSGVIANHFISVDLTFDYTVVESQYAVTAYFSSEQLLHFDYAG